MLNSARALLCQAQPHLHSNNKASNKKVEKSVLAKNNLKTDKLAKFQALAGGLF